MDPLDGARRVRRRPFPVKPAILSGVTISVFVFIGVVGWLGLGGDGNGSVVISGCGDALYGVSFVYTGNQSGYASTGYVPAPFYCYSYRLAPGEDFSLGVPIHSSDLNHTHEVGPVAVVPPFGFDGVTPALPIAIGPGGYVSLDVTVQAPLTGGTYGQPAVVVTLD